VLFVERPADALADAALQLAFDIARMHGAADILHRRVTYDARDAEIEVDLDVADVRAEAALGALRIDLGLVADRAAHLRRLLGELAQGQRLELAGVVAGWRRCAVFPLHRVRIDLPNL